jgi:hypothetical protein
MALKLQQRATVDDKFIALDREVYQMFLRREKNNAASFPGGREAYLKSHAGAHAIALSVLRKDGDGSRAGMDYEITRLRALPYARFTVAEHHGPWLVGITKPITIEHDEYGLTQKVFHLGCYAVYVPFRALEDQDATAMHFVPIKNTMSLYRHPHHRIDLWGSHSAYNDATEAPLHPLDKHIATCWGGFGGAIGGLLDIVDIPDLFRHIYLYLSRYDRGSPLVQIERLDFDTVGE